MKNLTSNTLTVFMTLISFLANSTTGYSSLLALVSPGAAQENGPWEAYTSKVEEFSVQMPGLPGVIITTTCLDIPRCEQKRVDRTYAVYADGVVYIVTSYSNPNHRQSLKKIIAERMEQFDSENFDVTPQGKATLNKFPGESFGIKSKKNNRVGINRFYLTKAHVYEIAVGTDDLNLPSIQKFFESFKLGTAVGKEIGDGSRKITASPAVLAVPRVTPASPKVDTVMSGGGSRVGIGGGGPGVGNGDGERTFKPNEVTHKAVIILKPSPEYTEQARKNQITGTVTLQMVLTSSGRVTSIRTVSGVGHGLTEKAIGAARNIYFLPAIKDGKRVSQYVRVEYNFSIY